MKRTNVIGFDGGPPSTGVRHFKLHNDWLCAKGELAEARREIRMAELTGDVTVEMLDRVRELEETVSEIKRERDACDRKPTAGARP